ncbi:MAG: ATP-binding protein [Gemmataceae bacterium]
MTRPLVSTDQPNPHPDPGACEATSLGHSRPQKMSRSSVRWTAAIVALIGVCIVSAFALESRGWFLAGVLAGAAIVGLGVLAWMPRGTPTIEPSPPPQPVPLADDVPAERLRQAQKMEAVGRLAGGIAHDFNNLLTAMGGFSEMLVNALPDGTPEHEMACEVLKASERAAGLTRQLLAFSRNQVLQPRLVDLNDLVANLNTMLRRLVVENIEMATILTAGPTPVRVDPGQIEQVLVNLVINARDAMPRGGKLSIATTRVETDESSHRGEAVLTVTDTGCGMSAETLSHVFEPFFTTKEKGKGTGLGLATAYGVVHQSGGRIEVESTLGHGTTFRIILPMVAEAVPAAAPMIPKPSIRPAAGKETILLAEDEDAVRSLARQTLEGLGYQVLEARNGADAFVRSRRHHGTIHLVLSDVIMPHLDGPALVRQLVARRPDIKALFMSGYNDSTLFDQGIDERDFGYLHKPFSSDELAQAVRDVLDRPVPAV